VYGDHDVSTSPTHEVEPLREHRLPAIIGAALAIAVPEVSRVWARTNSKATLAGAEDDASVVFLRAYGPLMMPGPFGCAALIPEVCRSQTRRGPVPGWPTPRGRHLDHVSGVGSVMGGRARRMR
jgi:hypothetical protein